jgi:AraC family transcriptional activator of pobA
VRSLVVPFRARAAAGGVLRVYRRDSAPWPYHAARMHGHRFYVLNYYDRGVGRIRFPGGTLRVAPGHVVLALPGELHDTSGIAHMGGWVVEFTGDLFSPKTLGSSLVLPHADATPWLAFAGRRFGQLTHATVPTLERGAWEGHLTRLEREVDDKSLGSYEAIQAIAQLLLIDLARLLAPAQPSQEAARTPLVSEVFAIIDQRFAEPRLSLAAIASAVGRSRSHIGNVLRAQTGLTVLQWLTERRMAEARRRLRETDEDITIIGERVGYLDPAYFARRFQRAHAMSPRAYRKSLR